MLLDALGQRLYKINFLLARVRGCGFLGIHWPREGKLRRTLAAM